MVVAFDRRAGPARKELIGWKVSKDGNGGGGDDTSDSRDEPSQNEAAISSKYLSTVRPSWRKSATAATASGRLPASVACFTASSSPSMAASVRPASASKRHVRMSALGVASCSTTA